MISQSPVHCGKDEGLGTATPAPEGGCRVNGSRCVATSRPAGAQHMLYECICPGDSPRCPETLLSILVQPATSQAPLLCAKSWAYSRPGRKSPGLPFPAPLLRQDRGVAG